MPVIRVIGPGRAGKAFATALEKAGWTVDGFLGRGDDLSCAAAGVDLLVLATPDQSIFEVANVVNSVPTTVVAHLSGALGLDVLAPHERRAAIHPLVSIPSDSGVSQLFDNGIWFSIVGDPLISEIVEDLKGRAIVVSEEDRVIYHAAAVIASNHLVALLGQVDRIVTSLGLPLEPFCDLAYGSLENVRRLGTEAALTGPASRGDEKIIEAHLAVLESSERDAYVALADACRRLAGR